MIFEEPTFLIQFGYQSQTVVRDAMNNDYADGVILSPSDYGYGKTKTLGRDVNKKGGTVLFDPQLYIPRTDKVAFEDYPYYNKSGGDNFETVVLTNSDSRRELCEGIFEVQKETQVDAYISPARFLDTVSDTKLNRWEKLTRTFIDVVEERDPGSRIIASLPVAGPIITDRDQRNKLLDNITKYDVDGFYVSVEFASYRSNPLIGFKEVKSYLELLKNLRYNWYEVILGHSDQIAHLGFALGINGFASGPRKNTRAFDTDRWVPEDDQGGGTLVYWYYSDPLLNELQVEQDLQALYAAPSFELDKLKLKNPNSPFETELFTGAPEDPPEWKLKDDSWDHYVWNCHQMSKEYTGLSLDERIQRAESNLRNAAEIYDDIKGAVGPRGNVHSDIFEDWSEALNAVTTKRDMDVIRRVMP